MKQILTLLFISLLILSCKQEKETLSTLNSTVENIKYEINGKLFSNWKISPNLKPDRLKVECGEKGSTVKFFSDIDTIMLNIKKGDTIQFNVLFKKDTALTEIVGIPKNVHFTDEYIKKHKGKFEIKVPEVHELANIMVAISKIGQIDSNMVDMTTKYRKEVLEHFLKYKSHPAIDTINKHITKAFDNDSYWYYYALKMNACGYLFNEKNEIINDGIINKMGFNYPDDPFVLNKELFRDFSEKSNFRNYYKEHQQYYDSLISNYKMLNPIDKMKNWLEKKFGFEYGNYLVTFSPLVGGAHSTQKFEDNGFDLTVMFVCCSDFSERYNRNVDEMINSRVVFTEIDHNFVNPISDKYVEKIDQEFKERSKWVVKEETNETSAYNTPYTVFNEYMTWAFFSLYCMDSFPKEDVDIFIPIMENMMVNSRGFVNFKRFNQKIMLLYKNKPKITVDEIYTEMLKWSGKE